MPLRVRRSITIAKGVKLNLGKSGASVSFGTRGLRHTIHSSGKSTSSIGIPGTGISYVTTSGGGGYSSGGYRSPSQIQRQLDRIEEVKQNEKAVNDFEDFVKSVKSIHKQCDDVIDWEYISELKEPFNPSMMGPKQTIANKELESFKPSFFQKLFTKKVEKNRAILVQAVKKAVEEDHEDYSTWKNLNTLSQRILAGEVDAYFQVIGEMNPLNDLLEYGSDFEFGTDDSISMEIEFRVKSKDIIPTFSMSLTKTGKQSKKDLTKTAFFDLVQDYVSSCSIRIARDMFAILPLETVVVHAVDNILNTETGHNEDITILSVLFDRKTLNMLNLDNIDPSDALNNFNHNMKFQKTAGFKPVERISY